MPVRHGQCLSEFAPIKSIIKAIEAAPGRNFVIGNAQVEGCPIIYCNKSICELTGYDRSEIVQKSCLCDFLYGPETDPDAVSEVRKALQTNAEQRISPVTYYKKDGGTFCCSVIVAPVKNEEGNVLMYIVNHEELEPEESRGSIDGIQVQGKRKQSVGRKGRKRSRMNAEAEEIALLERTIEKELRPINGHLKNDNNTNKLEEIPEINPPFDEKILTRKLSRSVSDLQSQIYMSEKSFQGTRGVPFTSYGSRNSSKTKKISSSLGDIAGTGLRSNSTALLHSISCNKDKDSIYDIAYPAVPPCRKNSINPGQKVAQVMSLGTDILPEYKVESPKIHPWTILHYSPFKAIWDWIVLFLVMYTAIVTPYMAAFVLTKDTNTKQASTKKSFSASIIYDDPLVVVDYIVDVMFIVDIFINFRTTCVDKNDEVVSDPCRIAVHYMKGWFLIDLIAAIPFELLIILGDTDQTTTLFGLLKTARLLRLVRVARKVDRYSEYGMALLLLLMFGFALIAHWLACIWYFIGNFEKPDLNMDGWLHILARDTRMPYNASDANSGPDLKTKYITALYFTLSSLTSVGFGNISPNTNGEKIFTIVIMFIGALMYAVIFGNVTAIIQGLYAGMAHYHATMRRIREFIRFYQIPPQLRQRLEDYAQYEYSYTNGIEMNEVLKKFPEGLQADICLHLNRHLLCNTPLFRSASPGCLRTLSLKLKTTHCPPGDYIIHSGDEIKYLYWIGRGTVEVIENDTITAILGKGDVFGENFSLVANRPVGKSKASVRALTYCDLHAIRRDDAFYIFRAYPDFRKNCLNNLQITFDLRDAEIEKMDQESSLLDISHTAYEPDIVFVSPESVRKRFDLPSSVQVNMDDCRLKEACNETISHLNMDPPQDEMINIEKGNAQTNAISDDIRMAKHATFNSDCCNCNMELRKEIHELKGRLLQHDRKMTNQLKVIMTLLETNSRERSATRKLGSATPVVLADDEELPNTSL